jgi:tripartite-type tricarboxylate transporter receptor subunit TctC
MLVRREFLTLAGAAGAQLATPGIVQAQAYPARPVRVIVPAAAGGGADIIARMFSQKLSENIGQQFFIENLPTGAGNVGTAIAAKAPPDGYTIILVTTSFMINATLNPKLPFDPVKDFAPITLAAMSPHALVVHPALPAKTVQELVALVKGNPGKYSYASPGTGQSGQLTGELFKLSLGLDLVHVPFNGAAPAIASTIAGHTPMLFVSLPSVASGIREGTLRALAVTSVKRTSAFPDIPTLAEAGFPNQESAFLLGFLAPAGTPKDVVDRLHREIAKVAGTADLKVRLQTLSFEAVANTPEEFGAQIKAEVDKWGRVVREAKIKVD